MENYRTAEKRSVFKIFIFFLLLATSLACGLGASGAANNLPPTPPKISFTPPPESTTVFMPSTNFPIGTGSAGINVWARIKPLLKYPFPVPGADLWMVFLVMAAILAGLSTLNVDLAQNKQKELFWAITGVSTVVITVWMLVRLANRAGSMIQIPIGGWMFTGLCLSDTLHALVDWYLPIWI